jgi:hypothetical protein
MASRPNAAALRAARAAALRSASRASWQKYITGALSFCRQRGISAQ